MAQLLEWPKFKTLTTANAGEHVAQEDISLIVDGDAKGGSSLGRQSGCFFQN